MAVLPQLSQEASTTRATLVPNNATTTCPFCKEDILIGAVVCKHCNRDLPSEPDVMTKSSSSKSGANKKPTTYIEIVDGTCLKCGGKYSFMIFDTSERKHFCESC